MITDNRIWPVLEEILAAMGQEFIEADVPVPSHMAIYPGAVVPLDYCANGGSVGAVRLVTSFPSTTLPNIDPRADCTKPLAYVVEVSAYRCVTVGGTSLKMIAPTMAQQTEMARTQLADMRALRRAIICTLPRRDHVLGPYTPYGPQGLVYGGVWTVTISEDF